MFYTGIEIVKQISKKKILNYLNKKLLKKEKRNVALWSARLDRSTEVQITWQLDKTTTATSKFSDQVVLVLR